VDRRAGIAVALLVVTTACTDRGARASFAVPDSADAELIVTTVAAWDTARPWTVEPEPVVRIGLREGDAPYLFQNVVGAEVLEDGRIAVADGLSREIRFFNAQGTYLLTSGGVGEGPGEFTSIRWLGRCGVGLFVMDWRLARATVLSLQGELVETFPLRDPDTGRTTNGARCGPDGQMLFIAWGELDAPREFEIFSEESLLRLWDPGSQRTVELGQYVSAERLQAGRTIWPHPFGRAVVFALDRDRVLIGRSERLQVEVRDFEGDLTRIFRGPDLDLSLPGEALGRYRSAEVSRPDSLLRQRLEAEGAAMPDSVPAYRRFLIDPLRNLWMERFEGPFEVAPREWGVFSDDGVFLGHVAMPEGFRLLDVTAELLAGVATDDLGVERIELYRLERH
jgi:hypothetical protein